MSVIQNNLSALQKKYPDYYRRMKEKKEERVWDIQFLKTRENVPAVVLETDTGEIRLNSIYRPKSEAEKWAGQYDFSHLQVNVIIFGLGQGEFVREIVKKMRDDARCFACEPDYSIFRKVIEVQDMTDIINDDKVQIIFGLESLFEILLPYVSWTTVVHQVVCVHPGYEKAYPDMKKDFYHTIRRLQDNAEIERKTGVYFSSLAVHNMIKNMVYVKDSNYLNELEGAFHESVTAIIVSAGPSLDKNIKEIQKAKGKAFIIATDTAVRHLEKQGVFYDCIVSVDPEKPESYFLGVPDCRKKPLFCMFCTNPGIMEYLTGRKIWYGREKVFSGLYQKYGYDMAEEMSGGSVATVAFGIAARMGIKTIILVGQDLAFGDRGTHAGGEQSDMPEENMNTFYQVEGIDGSPVRTRADWKIYLDWFENICKSKEFEVIDATEGGAKIHGSRIMTLSDAIDQYCVECVDFENILAKLPPTFSAERYLDVRKEFLQMGESMKRVEESARQGIWHCRRYLSEDQGNLEKERRQSLIKIREMNEQIMKEEMASELLDIYTTGLAEDELSDINTITGDAEEDERNSVKAVLAIFDAFAESAKKLQKPLEESLKLL